MQDSYNLAWKLALVVRGRAGEALLDSYDAERQPVGRQVVDRANQSVMEMMGWFTALGLRPDMTPDEVDARLAELYGPDGEQQRAELLAALDLTNAQFNAHGVELGQARERDQMALAAHLVHALVQGGLELGERGGTRVGGRPDFERREPEGDPEAEQEAQSLAERAGHQRVPPSIMVGSRSSRRLSRPSS